MRPAGSGSKQRGGGGGAEKRRASEILERYAKRVAIHETDPDSSDLSTPPGYKPGEKVLQYFHASP